MFWGTSQSLESFAFPPSGSYQDMVGVSGPGPEQRTRGRNVQGPCIGMVAMFGLRPWRVAQASHCSTPSALHSDGAGRAWKGQRPALGGGQRLQALSKDHHAVSQHTHREPSVGKAPSPPPRMVGGAPDLEPGELDAQPLGHCVNLRKSISLQR